MRLFLSDSFFDKFADLPRAIQQRVRDFQRKFRDNSTSSAIHLEPISDFLDPTLRSARINDAYRAILGSIGNDNFVCLYVDKHDKAYDWARNKRFEWNEHTQACQIIPITFEEMPVQSNTNSSEETDDQVLSKYSDAQLLNIGIPESLLPKVRSIKDLDDLDKAENFLPQDAYENLFAIFDGEEIEAIIQEIEAGKVSSGDELLSPNNKRRIVEITSDEDLHRVLSERNE